MARDSTLDGEFPSELGGGTTGGGGGGGDTTQQKAFPTGITQPAGLQDSRGRPVAVIYDNNPFGGSKSGIFIPGSPAPAGNNGYTYGSTFGSANSTVSIQLTIGSYSRGFPQVASASFAFSPPTTTTDLFVYLNMKPTSQFLSYYQFFEGTNAVTSFNTYPKYSLLETEVTTGQTPSTARRYPGPFNFTVKGPELGNLNARMAAAGMYGAGMQATFVMAWDGGATFPSAFASLSLQHNYISPIYTLKDNLYF